MTNLRSGAAIVGAAALLVTLVGCSAAATTAPTPKATSTPVAAAPTPAAKPVAAPAQPAAPTASPACAGNQPGTKHIIVSISEQHLYACDGQALLADAPVTTGASAITNVNDATPTGTFHITNKIRNTVLAGSDVNGPWNDPVQYWMPFSGGYGFHDASWQTFPLGSPLYKTQGSHGCVHLPLDVIATLFNWAQVGTIVTIQS
jgi:lipoprotein-anchoring transpeptidase ErfK/SrfK